MARARRRGEQKRRRRAAAAAAASSGAGRGGSSRRNGAVERVGRAAAHVCAAQRWAQQQPQRGGSGTARTREPIPARGMTSEWPRARMQGHRRRAAAEIGKLVVEGCVDCVVRLQRPDDADGRPPSVRRLLRGAGGRRGRRSAGGLPRVGLSLVGARRACARCASQARRPRLRGCLGGCDGVFWRSGRRAPRDGGVVSVDEAEQDCETQLPGLAPAVGRLRRRRAGAQAAGEPEGSGAGGRLAYRRRTR